MVDGSRLPCRFIFAVLVVAIAPQWEMECAQAGDRCALLKISCMGGVVEMLRRVNFGDFAVEVKRTELGHYALTLRCGCCWTSRQWAAIYLCEEKLQLRAGFRDLLREFNEHCKRRHLRAATELRRRFSRLLH
jgi:hypothetical protein